ncbi:polysaccharide biosynthesis protein [Exiguobacterium undae]|uniref:Polysaccharide biosynthesis protein n=2 Tax=Exiguobacterium undae TaxID=169177 RepID=A0ABX2V4J6_9BACL|nr:polysaccharide biosynthesis protein [Exiguobacterium undae]
MSKRMTIAQGAALLAISSYVSKLLSFFYRIPYQNMAGDVGLYVYQTVYPLFAIAAALGIYALPVVVAKLTLHHPEEKREVLWAIFFVLSGMSLILGTLGWWIAPEVARLFGDAQLVEPLRAVTFTFYLLPVIAVLRGMFQADLEMRPTAFSQITENGVRVCLLLLVTYYGVQVGANPYQIGASAHMTALGGSVASLILLLRFAKGRIGRPVVSKQHIRRVGRVLLTSGMAVSIASLALLLMQLIDGLTFVNLLGDSIETKMEKGIFDRGYPLLQFAILFATSISLASVPTLLLEYRKRNDTATKHHLETLLRSGLLIAAAATVGLVGVMRPLNIALYQDDNGTMALSWLAATGFTASLSMIIVSCLQSVDAEKYAFAGVIVGLAVKFGLNIWLIPAYGMTGAGMATFGGFAVMAAAQLILLNRKFGRVTAGRAFYIKLMKAVLPMAIFLYVIEQLFQLSGWESRIGATIEVGLLVLGGAIVFCIFALRIGVLTEREWALLPFGEKLYRIHQRRGII